MSDRVYTQDEKRKLTTLIQEGMSVKQEVQDLSDGLRDTVKAIAEEMNIQAKILSKAITVAHKGNLHEHEDDLDELQTILATTGHTS